MKILITSGGTTEKIDEVRKIKNTASGRLGSLIAEEFSKKPQMEITYLCGTETIVPKEAKTEIITVESVDQLMGKITNLLEKHTFDAVIHAMAVSDYKVRKILPANDLANYAAEIITEKKTPPDSAEKIANDIQKAILHKDDLVESYKKISSDVENLVIIMEKTPKVISIVKKIQPKTILVGFKLLFDVSEEKLVEAGYKLLSQNKCDFVLANDLSKIQGDNHSGILIGSEGIVGKFCSKQEIAIGITNKVLQKIGGVQ